MSEFQFENRVAVVTGAGGGLGRAHALMLAARGAKVVVNDLGGNPDGSGDASSSMADKVLEEIKAAGGEATANYDSVDSWEGGESIIKTAIDAYGKLDIVINNAGILRDRTMLNMSSEEYNRVMDIHVDGSWYVSRAAVPHLRENNYGRVIFTSSGAGLWGNFGQTNYSAAKMAVVGMMLAMKLEMAKYNCNVNVISPLAASRLLGTVMTEEQMETLNPDFVAAMVVYLCTEECTETGGIFMAGGGNFAKAQMVANDGITIESRGDISVENIAKSIYDISDMSKAQPYSNAGARRVNMAE
jgi:NAD(P)-dependent dehydrogenase (short-subunit alcohol dehydrogenase family)